MTLVAELKKAGEAFGGTLNRSLDFMARTWRGSVGKLVGDEAADEFEAARDCVLVLNGGPEPVELIGRGESFLTLFDEHAGELLGQDWTRRSGER